MQAADRCRSLEGVKEFLVDQQDGKPCRLEPEGWLGGMERPG